MKKAIAILMIAGMLAGFAGCASAQPAAAADEPKATTAATATSAPVEPTPEPTAEPSGMLDTIESALEESGYTIVNGQLGSGSVGFDLYILSLYSEDVKHYRISTDQSTLLSALQEFDLVEGEDVSWGFNVTTVDGLKADYDKCQEYWNIYLFSESTGKFSPLETSIVTTPVAADDVYMFMMRND